jgi:translation elongation factor P/translation initiation factor 5A
VGASFPTPERVEDVQLERLTMEFLYSEGNSCTFMHPDNFEQIEVPIVVIGPAARF